jgi:electron transport complex protein RnfE
VTNCAIIGRAEAFASKNAPLISLLDGFATGLGFCITLVLLGSLRELSGRGTLLEGADMLLGEWGRHLTITVIPEHPGFLLAMLPPGAFFGLALLIAARNAWEARQTSASTASTMVQNTVIQNNRAE